MASGGTALVTGASGFAAPYLVNLLIEEGREVIAAVHGHQTQELPADVTTVSLDVTDRASLADVFTQHAITEVYHPAGLSRPADERVDSLYRVNLEGTRRLLEAVAQYRPGARVLIVTSAYVYGSVSGPIDEQQPLNPVNDYGVSKAAADMAAGVSALSGLHVVRARPFNHSGPGQTPSFVLPVIVDQVAQILRGDKEPRLELGNVHTIRDFSDVRDIVRGYMLALERGTPGRAYNLGSGRACSIRELVDIVCNAAGIEVELTIGEALVRADDIPSIVCNPGLAARELGWVPTITLEDCVADMLSHTGALVL